jgi:cell division protein FtsL
MTRTSSILVWFSLTLFASLGLYHTSYKVEELDRELRAFNSKIEAEKKNIHVLKAEWVYLSNPARIEEAARKHLDLKPTAPQQVTGLHKISQILPSRKDILAKAKSVPSTYETSTQRPVAHNPKVAASETGRVNTRLVIQKVKTNNELPTTSIYQDVDEDRVALASPGSNR